MQMVAHDPAAAKRLGIPQSVGREFAAADAAHAPTRLPERMHRAAHHPTRPAGRGGRS
jgi:hypothetical protein